MLFNSLDFLVFFAVVYSIYLILQRHRRGQNWMLLVASYIFYGWWDWRFLSLILISTIVDFTVSHRMASTSSDVVRKRLLVVSVVVNLGILGFFKYFGFFIENASALLESIGLDAGPTLNILLPVGISFYTFQTLGYTIDVYRRQIGPCRRLDDFALYVAFFPQLVAGPIERSRRLLGQIERPRVLSPPEISAGIWLILWGLTKKVVIADNLSDVVESVFGMEPARSGFDVLLGALAFTIQIYGDFSGYSDIARGLAKLLGFDLMVNFRLPYIAETPSDFWQRWHISLSSWLRDYLYIPLGGNRGGNTNRNLMITMILGGLWHGAAWNFVIWGAYHGGLLVGYREWERRRRHQPSMRATARVARALVMFAFTVFGWVIFRSSSLDVLGWWITNVGLEFSPATVSYGLRITGSAAILAAVWAWQQSAGNLLAPAGRRPIPVAVTYSALVVALFLYGAREQTEFIYFQF